MFGFGHFIFESAAQEQGLREIRFVGDPDRRGLTIQRVIQQAGLRGFDRAASSGRPRVERDTRRPRRPIPPRPASSRRGRRRRHRATPGGTGSPTPSAAKRSGSPNCAESRRPGRRAVRSRPHDHRPDRPAALSALDRRHGGAAGNIPAAARVLIPWSVTMCGFLQARHSVASQQNNPLRFARGIRSRSPRPDSRLKPENPTQQGQPTT